MKEIDEKYLKSIFLNILKAIIIIFCFLIFNLAYIRIDATILKRGIQIFTMILLFVSIYIFEKAYKEDSGKKAIEGIEILVLSACVLTTEHITNKLGFDFKAYSLSISYVFAIYFVLKSIIIYTQGRKEIEKSMSDIAEIVKKEEPSKKEAFKRKKEDVEQKEEKIEKIDKKTKDKKQKNKIKNKTSKKRGKRK